MLRFPLHRLFDDPARYPAPMTGRIVLVDKGIKGSKKDSATIEADLQQTSEPDAPTVADAQLALVLPMDTAAPASRSPKDRARDVDPDEDLLEAVDSGPPLPSPPALVPPPARGRAIPRNRLHAIRDERPCR